MYIKVICLFILFTACNVAKASVLPEILYPWGTDIQTVIKNNKLIFVNPDSIQTLTAKTATINNIIFTEYFTFQPKKGLSNVIYKASMENLESSCHEMHQYLEKHFGKEDHKKTYDDSNHTYMYAWTSLNENTVGLLCDKKNTTGYIAITITPKMNNIECDIYPKNALHEAPIRQTFRLDTFNDLAFLYAENVFFEMNVTPAQLTLHRKKENFAALDITIDRATGAISLTLYTPDNGTTDFIGKCTGLNSGS